MAIAAFLLRLSFRERESSSQSDVENPTAEGKVSTITEMKALTEDGEFGSFVERHRRAISELRISTSSSEISEKLIQLVVCNHTQQCEFMRISIIAPYLDLCQPSDRNDARNLAISD